MCVGEEEGDEEEAFDAVERGRARRAARSSSSSIWAKSLTLRLSLHPFPPVQTALAFTRTWHHVSARDAKLGKLAVDVAQRLMGKHRPMYDQAVDAGDYVVVSAARHVVVTGKKDQQKVYRHHTMYPGGLKEITYADMMRRKPDEVGAAVQGWPGCYNLNGRCDAWPCAHTRAL